MYWHYRETTKYFSQKKKKKKQQNNNLLKAHPQQSNYQSTNYSLLLTNRLKEILVDQHHVISLFNFIFPI